MTEERDRRRGHAPSPRIAAGPRVTAWASPGPAPRPRFLAGSTLLEEGLPSCLGAWCSPGREGRALDSGLAGRLQWDGAGGRHSRTCVTEASRFVSIKEKNKPAMGYS